MHDHVGVVNREQECAGDGLTYKEVGEERITGEQVRAEIINYEIGRDEIAGVEIVHKLVFYCEICDVGIANIGIATQRVIREKLFALNVKIGLPGAS